VSVDSSHCAGAPGVEDATSVNGCTIEDLHGAFRQKLLAFLHSKVKDHALAEDIVQESFAKLSRLCGRGDSCSSPQALLFRIASNLAADHFRRPHARAHVVGLEEAELSPTTRPRLDKEYLDCFGALLETLPEPYRTAVILADIKQMPHKEIAAALGISVSGVKSRVQRGRAKLRDLLSQLCEIEHDRCGGVISCEPRR
jgi:RNA polymerase sigma-70 factor (ECF subfamily)